MSRPKFACYLLFLFAGFAFSGRLMAQTVCDQGNAELSSAQPAGIAPAEIIQKFADKESVFRTARTRYGYTLSISIQTLDLRGQVDGEYHQVSAITLNDSGKRVEETTFAPQSTLVKLSLTEDDLDDVRKRLALSFTPEELRHFQVSYVGRQHVDQLNTYVFDVSPRNPGKDSKLFKGRIWVDDQDLMIVKTCGKPREDENAKSKKKNAIVNLAPLFVTYREQIDGQYWFPTYSRADEFLRFPKGLIHVREIVKYSGYKPLAPG